MAASRATSVMRGADEGAASGRRSADVASSVSMPFDERRDRARRTRCRRRAPPRSVLAPVRIARRALGVLGAQGARSAGSASPSGAGQPVDGSALDAELGEQLLRAGAPERSVGDERLLHGEGEATAQGLGEQLEARLGVVLGARRWW